MANTLYNSAKNRLLNPGTLGVTDGSSIDWIDDNIKLVLVDTTLNTPYTFSASHVFLSDIPATARIATSANLAGKTVTNGVADATSPSEFTALPAHGTLVAVIYKDTGTASTSPLILYVDTGSGLPLPAGAVNVLVTFDTGANRIFSL